MIMLSPQKNQESNQKQKNSKLTFFNLNSKFKQISKLNSSNSSIKINHKTKTLFAQSQSQNYYIEKFAKQLLENTQS